MGSIPPQRKSSCLTHLAPVPAELCRGPDDHLLRNVLLLRPAPDRLHIRQTLLGWGGVSASCHPQRYKNVLFCSHRAMPGPTDALFSPMPWESLSPSSHPLEAWVPASRQVGALPLAPRASASRLETLEKSEKFQRHALKQDLWKIFFVDALPFERGGDGDHGNRSVGACVGERNGRSRSEEGDEAVVEEEADREVRSGRGPGLDFFSGGWETHRREPAYLAQGTNEHERNSIRKTSGGKRV